MSKKILTAIIISCLYLTTSPAFAAQISVVNFLGDVVGQVLPDGKVINAENNIIGTINSDSQVVNQEGDIIGGIAPQGIAIGNDFTVLGRSSQDGSVLSPAGRSIGRVLPNSLVIDNDFNIIGSVLFPGIIYSDSGTYVGRLSGDGSYTDIQGNKIGFITPDGFAYKKVADSYILDGRLISSKMVASLQGEVIGSINSEGKVLDFSGKFLAQIRANGFAYNDKNIIIGQIINNGYAFDKTGNPIGFVTFNGRVIKEDTEIGYISSNNLVLNKDQEVIGFAVSSKATATDLEGNFLGIVLPSGSVIKGDQNLGYITSRGVVIGQNGNVIGKISKTGPVFDYNSNIVAHATSNGQARNLGGAVNGKIKGQFFYDLTGNISGIVYQTLVATSLDNKFLGTNGINNKFISNQNSLIASNYGYLFDESGSIVGQSTKLGRVYNQQGTTIGYITPNGEVTSASGSFVGNLIGHGIVVNDINKIIGQTFFAQYLSDNSFLKDLLISADNVLYNKGQKIEAKILPDSSIVVANKEASVEYMPQVGRAYQSPVVVGYNSSLVGYGDYDNKLRDIKLNTVGTVSNNAIGIDNSGYPLGEVIKTGAILDFNCAQVGALDLKAQAKNPRDILLGKALPNNFIVSQSSIVAYKAPEGNIIDSSSNIIGYTSKNGQVYDFSGNSLGCINPFGYLKKSEITLGKIIKQKNVISFDNKIIGRSILDGTIVDENNQTIGQLKSDNSVSTTNQKDIGLLFEYKYAFDNNNNFIGVINSKAEVINPKAQVIANVSYEGKVFQNNKFIGYALYDLFVYDNDMKPLGYIDFSGQVKDFSGAALGRIKNGFLVDSQGVVIARPNRDFYIRNDTKKIIGLLKPNAQVVNNGGDIIGIMNDTGEVIDPNSNVIGIANFLQFYSTIKVAKRQSIVVDKEGNVIGYVDENGDVYDKNGNKIGNKQEGNLITDKDGNPIGQVLGEEKVFDEEGNLIGTTKADGTVVDLNGKVIGTINENGEVISPNGNIIGGIGKNWYEKIKAKPVAQPTDSGLQTIGSLPTASSAGSSSQQSSGITNNAGSYIKSISIALTPDGEYLGDILENGDVVDKKGNILGKKQPDGLIIDKDGTLIGIEEIEKKKGEELFIPTGSFGSGGAFGTGNAPTNLGPGGGYGPGERYDTARVQALAVAQAQRRQAVAVGAVKSSYNPSSFNYMQDNWDGVESTLSSWKVDMSEMILADKPIPAVLARSIYNSSTEVPVTAFVERNVYSEEGRNIIIPAGSRLIGKVGGFGSSSSASSNAAKVEITWDRLIRPDGSMFNLAGSVTGDAQGRQGALGYVDQQLSKKYLSPIMVSVLTSAGAYIMATDDSSDGETETSKQQAANDARDNFLSTMDSVFQSVLQDKLAIQAITFVPAGTRIIVYPKKDLWLRTPERDTEANKFSGDQDIKAEALVSGNSDVQAQAGGTQGSNNNQVVYGNNNQNNPQAQSGGTALVGSGAPAQQQQPNIIVAPPPPPPSSSSSKTSSSSSKPSSSSSKSNAPVLF